MNANKSRGIDKLILHRRVGEPAVPFWLREQAITECKSVKNSTSLASPVPTASGKILVNVEKLKR